MLFGQTSTIPYGPVVWSCSLLRVHVNVYSTGGALAA